MTSAGAADTAPTPTPQSLREPVHRVDPAAIRWWTLRSALGSLALLVPQLGVLGVLVATGLDPAVLVVTSALTLVAGLVHLLVVPRVRFRVHRWEATPDAVHTLAGWIGRTWRSAPVARVQTVDTDQGPLQRLFGLTTVVVTTASSAGAVRIEGLDATRAHRLAHDLTVAAHRAGGDAT